MKFKARVLPALFLVLLVTACAEIKGEKDDADKSSSSQGGVCGIASCKSGSHVDQAACACVEDGQVDGDSSQCLIDSCAGGFIFDQTTCSCKETQTQNQNNTAAERPIKGKVTLMSRDGAPSGRRGHSAVWTGTEMIVWGGLGKSPQNTEAPLGDGAAYDPKTDTWRPLSQANAPTARAGHRAVWTGKYMAIVGKDIDVYPAKAVDGALYDPANDTWTALSPVNAPEARSYFTVAAVGSRIVVWGGSRPGPSNESLPLASGAVYDPDAGTWSPMSANGAPTPPVVTMHGFDDDGKFLVFGGLDSVAYPKVVQFNHTYDLDQHEWTALSMRTESTYQVISAAPVIWTGDKLIHVSGVDQGNNQGMTYYLSSFERAANTWSQKALGSSALNFCAGDYHSLWTGRYIAQTDPGCLLDPESGTAYDLPPVPKDIATEVLDPGVVEFDLQDERAVWTGEELLIFGGSYRASEAPESCPDGAPCVPPAEYEGMALGARYDLND